MTTSLMNAVAIDHRIGRDYCVWNHISTGKLNVNGQYTYDDDGSYSKTIDSACAKPTTYLWRNPVANTWQISTQKQDSSKEHIIQCNQSSLVKCSSGHWGTENPTVYVQAGRCPEWRCTSITTGITALAPDAIQGCQGPFPTYVGFNAWKHSTNEVYFYFLPTLFKWVCSNSRHQTECPISVLMESDPGWVRLDAGESMNMNFSWLTETGSTESNTFKINCIASPNYVVYSDYSPHRYLDIESHDYTTGKKIEIVQQLLSFQFFIIIIKILMFRCLLELIYVCYCLTEGKNVVYNIDRKNKRIIGLFVHFYFYLLKKSWERQGHWVVVFWFLPRLSAPNVVDVYMIYASD
eukprot:63110_1